MEYSKIKKLMFMAGFSLRKLGVKYQKHFTYIQQILKGNKCSKNAKALRQEIIKFLEEEFARKSERLKIEIKRMSGSN